MRVRQRNKFFSKTKYGELVSVCLTGKYYLFKNSAKICLSMEL
jgi:hypothetical protein